MAKLSKAQKRDLAAIIHTVEQVQFFLSQMNVSVCKRDKVAMTSLHFTREPIPEVLQTEESRRLGEYALSEIAKDIGSPVCFLPDALKRLRALFMES